MIRRFPVFVAACLLIVLSVPAVAEQPSYLKLTLLSTNDLHARLYPFDISEKHAGTVPQMKNVGGAARRATYVKQVRAQSNWPVLLLDSGDTTYYTSALGKAFHGLVDVDVMNTLEYMAMCPGNHDFQWDSVHTLNNLKASKFPWVCANLVDEKTGKPFLPPYVIREVGGVRIALFGLITQLVNSEPYVAREQLGLRQINPIEVASKLVPELRKQADIVICLSHLGIYQDPKLAREVPGIDVILGGHSHARLATPTMVPVGTPSATFIGAVPVVQAFCHGSEIGHTDVIFYRDLATGRYSLMSCKGWLVSMDSTVPDDPTIVKLLERWEAKRRALQAPAQPASSPAPAAAVAR